MKQKTLKSFADYSGNCITLTAQQIKNELGENKRILNAVLLPKNMSTQDVSAKIHVKYGDNLRQIIDYVSPKGNNTFSINVTEEINCLLENSAESITLEIENVQNTLTLPQKIDLQVQYVPIRSLKNAAYYPINAGTAGEGKINLATGKLQFSNGASGVDLVYNGWQSAKSATEIDDAQNSPVNFKHNCGLGWKLGAEQYLVKRADGDNQQVYTYVDDMGNYHDFTEKYYYLNEDGNKAYLSKSQVLTDFNGKLTFNGKEVKTERRSTDGMTLQTDYKSFKGGNLLEHRQEEQINLEETAQACKRQLEQYVAVTADNGKIDDKADLKEKFLKGAAEQDAFNQFVTEAAASGKLLLTENEALQYNSLWLQQTSESKVLQGKTVTDSSFNSAENYSDSPSQHNTDGSTNKIYNVGLSDSQKKFKQGAYDTRLINLKRLVKDLRADLTTLTHKSNYAKAGNDSNYLYDIYKKFLETNGYYKKITNDMLTTLLDGCSLKVSGAGRSKINESSDENIPTGLLVNLNDSNVFCDLEIPYEHLEGNYCDLQAEFARITDDLDKFNAVQSIVYKNREIRDSTGKYTITQVYDRDTTEIIKIEKAAQKTLEKRLRVFQKQFSNRVEKLQQNIAKFEQEINDFVEKEQRAMVERQINMLNTASQHNVEDAQKYYKQYVNALSQLDTLKTQLPVRFVTSTNDNTMGFNENGVLVALFDAYDNQTAIIYEDGKITSIRNTDNGEISFEYNEEGLLTKINDEKENVTHLTYDGSSLKSVTSSNGETSTFAYGDYGFITSVTNSNGYGIELTYDPNSRIVKVEETTALFSVEENAVLKEEQPVKRLLAKIDYHGAHTSVTVTERNDKSTTYIFNQLGNPVTVYEGKQYSEGTVTQGVTLEYADGKQSYSASQNNFAPNLLEGVSSVDNNLLEDYPTQKRTRTYTYTISDELKNAGNFIFSAWVKADSAHITNPRITEVEQDAFVAADKYKPNRKFGLSAQVNYGNETSEVYSASFDWLNTDWQYLALPIAVNKPLPADTLPATFPLTLSEQSKAPTGITLTIDYSYNVGAIEVGDVSLRVGDCTKSTYDESGNKVSEYDSANNSTTVFVYDEDGKLIEQTLTDKFNRKYTTKYKYNKQGVLVRSTDYNGVVEETVLDDKGRELKKIVYNAADPTSKFYTESKRNDKGVVTAELDESGRFNSTSYTYDHNGDITVQANGKGNKTAFGYKDGNLVSISGTTDGEQSTNTMHYTNGMLTEVSNVETNYNFAYDGWGRTTKVEVANEQYAATEYLSETETKTTFADGSVTNTLTDKNGNVTEQTTTFADGEVEKVTSTRDEQQRVTQVTVDINNELAYTVTSAYEQDKLISETRTGANPLTKNYTYAEDGELQTAKYVVGGKELEYIYVKDTTPDKRDVQVNLPFELTQQFAYDGLGRTKQIALGKNLVKDIYYAKYGDHATNKVNSVWYGVNGVRKDNVKYAYDKADNITTVTENGVVTACYVFDGLNRLVRENNPLFGKNTYTYDSSGNILTKTSNGTKYEFAYNQHGWKDQLVELTLKHNGNTTVQRFEYDSLGNPTLYRSKPMTWQGRRLKTYQGISYTYDVNGIRTSKSRNGVTYKFIYDGNNLVAEQHISNTASEWLYFIYGVDGVVGFEYNGNTYLYRKNVQGDITHVYKVVAQGEAETLELVAQYAYDAWGNYTTLVDVGGIADINPFRYRSYYFDVETKLYYLQTRYYDPEIGRFISADSIEYLDPETLGGLNLYSYCINNPIMYFDPTGEFIITCILIGLGIGIAVGATIGGVIAYNNASASGATGWELFGKTLLGVLGGAVIGGAIGALAGAGIGIFAAGASMFGAGVAGAGMILSNGAIIGAGALAMAGVGTMVIGGGIAIGATALASKILMATGFGPRQGHNQYENKQFRDACEQLHVKDKDIIQKLKLALEKEKAKAQGRYFDKFKDLIKFLTEQLNKINRGH